MFNFRLHRLIKSCKLKKLSKCSQECPNYVIINIETFMYNLLMIIVVWATVTGNTDAGKVEKWTVGLSGTPGDVDEVARESGCRNLGRVASFTDVYLFERPKDPFAFHRTKRSLEGHPMVDWADVQRPQKRVKRDIYTRLSWPSPMHKPQVDDGLMGAGPGQVVDSSSLMSEASVIGMEDGGDQTTIPQLKNPQEASFNDDLWRLQWYLKDKSDKAATYPNNNVDLNVEEVWRMGYTGQGVVVSIIDDGLEWNHTDIFPNYDPRASWDMNNNKSDPFPQYDSHDRNNHGTRCAGVVAMAANNRKCGVGVAPRARVGGIKCLDGEVFDSIESMSLLHNIDYIDIYSGSWGPMDNGQTVDGPKRLASRALERGIKFGRQGKGVLYIWANGNGGAMGDNCNCDGYVNSIYTIAIGGVTQLGLTPFYGERCSSTLAVTCSSGSYNERKIVTTDLHNKCTVDYTGTSAAAPLAAGVYALLLEANPNITWRDAQHLTAWTSNPIPIGQNPGWKRNGAGLLFNNRFGFGLLDAKAMVEAALKWINVPKKSICIVGSSNRLPIFIQSRNQIKLSFITNGCQLHGGQQPATQPRVPKSTQINPIYHQNLHQNMKLDLRPTPVIYLEHVQVIVDIEYTSRGKLDIFLISPAGTVSTLLTRRPLDDSRQGFQKWPLMSVDFWGEISMGEWNLIVRDHEGLNQRGLIRNATLLLHGTTNRPEHMNWERIYETSNVEEFLDHEKEFEELGDLYDFNNYRNEMSLLVRED